MKTEPRALLLHDCLLDGADSRRMKIEVLATRFGLRVIAALVSERPEGDFWRREARFEITVSLAWPVSCTVNGLPRAWSVTHRHAEILNELRWWALSQLWDAEVIETEDCLQIDFGLGDGVPEYRRCQRAINDVEQLIADQVWRRRNTAAATLVGGLDDDAAFLAYAGLLHDETDGPVGNPGRIAQMLEVCPNLFTLVSAAPPCTARQSLLHRIRHGDKLHTLIRDALAMALQGRSARISPISAHASSLVRHLPVRSLDDLFTLLHAPGVDVNDLVEAGSSANAWATYMVEWGHRARAFCDSQAGVRRLGGFFSRHAVDLHGASCRPDEILDWLAGSGDARVPDRSSSPRRIIDAVHRWHATLWRLDQSVETPLHAGPIQAKITGIHAVPIPTVGALLEEGARMAHCVASLAAEAVAGTCVIYRANVLGTPLTLAVYPAGEEWALLEASGFSNHRPTADQLKVISRWVRGLR